MGKIICCGLGPGDPDLMSVRAAREVRGARHVRCVRRADHALRGRVGAADVRAAVGRRRHGHRPAGAPVL